MCSVGYFLICGRLTFLLGTHVINDTLLGKAKLEGEIHVGKNKIPLKFFGRKIKEGNS